MALTHVPPILTAKQNAVEGIKVVDRFFTVPLDYSNPDGATIRVFARNLVPAGKESGEAKEKKNDLPFCQSSTSVIIDNEITDYVLFVLQWCSFKVNTLIQWKILRLTLLMQLCPPGGPGFEVELQSNSGFAKEVCRPVG